MREIVETATDVAAIAIGDPSLLGPLRAAKGMAECQSAFSNAVKSGTLWRTETGADGSYVVHVFVDEEPAAPLRGFLHDPITIEQFRVPSGRLFVAGEEDFVGPDGGERPLMGREINVPAGEFHLTAYRVELPPDILETSFREQASPVQHRARSLGSLLRRICVLISLAGVIIGLVAYARTASRWPALSALTIIVFGWWLQIRFRRGMSYRAAESLFRRIARELPAVVIVLRRHQT